jgi:nucleoside-diphosphate-sugar epimerase
MIVEDGTNGTFDVGRSDCRMTLEQFAYACCDAAGVDRNVVTAIDPPAHAREELPLDESFLRSIGWSPKVELREGLQSLLSSLAPVGSNA